MSRIKIACFFCAVLMSSSAHAQAKPLEGVIDIHVHASPDSTARSIDEIDLAKLAQSRGMRALVLKNHFALPSFDARNPCHAGRRSGTEGRRRGSNHASR